MLLAVGSLFAYAWLFYTNEFHASGNEGTLCVIKNATGFACPACGSTRSLLALFHGNITEALMLNPLGILLFFILLISPLWISVDVLMRKQSMTEFYYRCEQRVRQKTVAIPLISLVIVNWIWNIYKGL